jgi:very-short-patch-repair endonuclease
MGVDNSLFDQADIRYGGRIRLREHFRCMPEIIQFSNQLSYQREPLVPLRQYGTERLTLVTVTRRCRDGYRTGSRTNPTNPPEAQALADAVCECVADPEYEGKSMGVISLLGSHQARLIERDLMNRLGPEEVDGRRLVCGDAYAFQGDERDVMFLSMVAAPGDGIRLTALTRETHKRRFNVAVSRARDQLWLFHSVTPADLSPQCLRHQLLTYCMDPRVESTDASGIDSAALRRDAQSADRTRIAPPVPFDSWFEVDVYLRIVGRGYRVTPQYEVAGFRIDLVVEGMYGRLAVECDGDAWHGPDRYDYDMARSRDLERCGWTICRVAGSSFEQDPDAALRDVWDALNRLQVGRPHPTVGSPKQVESAATPHIARQPDDRIHTDPSDRPGPEGRDRGASRGPGSAQGGPAPVNGAAVHGEPDGRVGDTDPPTRATQARVDRQQEKDGTPAPHLPDAHSHAADGGARPGAPPTLPPSPNSASLGVDSARPATHAPDGEHTASGPGRVPVAAPTGSRPGDRGTKAPGARAEAFAPRGSQESPPTVPTPTAERELPLAAVELGGHIEYVIGAVPLYATIELRFWVQAYRGAWFAHVRRYKTKGRRTGPQKAGVSLRSREALCLMELLDKVPEVVPNEGEVEVGRIDWRSRKSALVVRVVPSGATWPASVDVREHWQSPGDSGWSRKGLRIDLAQLPEVRKLYRQLVAKLQAVETGARDLDQQD